MNYQYIFRLEIIDDYMRSDFDIDEIAQEVSQLLREKYGMKVAEWGSEDVMLVAILDEKISIKKLLDKYRIKNEDDVLNQSHLRKLMDTLEENNNKLKY